MKTLLALLLLAPAAPSFAAIPDQIRCNEPNHAPDHAWSATILKGQIAEVVEEFVPNPPRRTRLRCTQAPNAHPERIGFTLLCQANARFGYVLTVSNSLFRTTARLDQRIFPRGTRNLTTLSCGNTGGIHR